MTTRPEATAKELDGYETRVLCHEKMYALISKTSPSGTTSRLSNLAKQEHFLFQLMLIQNECIHSDCYHKFNKLEGCQQDVYDLCGGRMDNTFACPKCKQVCRVIVPFINMGSPWHWGKLERKKDDKPTTAQ